MKKAILLVAALALCIPTSSANAVCVESEGGSVRVHSGSCGAMDLMLLDDLVDAVVCLLDSSTATVDC